MNYLDNTYAFRQDSTFLYSSVRHARSGRGRGPGREKGHSLRQRHRPGRHHLDGAAPDVEGPGRPGRGKNVIPLGQAGRCSKGSGGQGAADPFPSALPAEHVLKYGALLGLKPAEVNARVSTDLIKRSSPSARSRARRRSLRSKPPCLRLIKCTMRRCGWPSRVSGNRTSPEGWRASRRRRRGLAFPTILSKNGQILHNHTHVNRLRKSDMIVVDAGASSPGRYAADITRTVPVGGAFTPGSWTSMRRSGCQRKRRRCDPAGPHLQGYTSAGGSSHRRRLEEIA